LHTSVERSVDNEAIRFCAKLSGPRSPCAHRHLTRSLTFRTNFETLQQRLRTESAPFSRNSIFGSKNEVSSASHKTQSANAQRLATIRLETSKTHISTIPERHTILGIDAQTRDSKFQLGRSGLVIR
jgi:hypothetical protein